MQPNEELKAREWDLGRGLCASLRFPGLESKPGAVGLLQLVVQPHSPARPRERYSADLLPRTLSKVHPGSAQPDVQASSFNVLHLEKQIRGAATHLQCPEQQSPEDPNCILPPQRGTILLLLCQQEASDLPQLWRGRAGFQERNKTKTRGYQDAMEGASCKNRHSQLPQGVLLAEDMAGQRLFWPLRAERTSNPPMPEQGSSQLSQLHCGAQPASLSPEVGAGGIYTPSSAPN